MAEANEIYDFLLNNVGSAAAQNFKGQHGQSGTDLLLGLASTYNADPNLSSKLTSLAGSFDQNAYNNSPEFRAIKAQQDRAAIEANAKINNNITLPAPTLEPTRLTTPNAPPPSTFGNSGVNYDDQTLEILAGLNAAQPSTQQVDYSGFMQDFQPVLNYPNYFVPQQGLLQNTPVLATLSDLDVIHQRPQVITNMLDQYPTLESDFQQSFAVSPDTFNMNVYQPLPYDPNYWQSLVNQGGGTSSSGIDLGTAAAIIAGGASLLGGDGDDTTTTTTDDTVIDIDPNTVIPTVTLDDDTTVITGKGSETTTSGTDVVNVTVTTDNETEVTGKGDETSTSGTDVVNVTVNDDDTNVTGKVDDTSISGTDVVNVTSTENANNNQGTGSDTSISGTDVSSISSIFDLTDTSTWVWGGNPITFNVDRTDGTTDVIKIESKEQLDRLIDSQNRLARNKGIDKTVFDSRLINSALSNNLLNTGGGLNFTTEFGVNETGLTGKQLNQQTDTINQAVGSLGLDENIYYTTPTQKFVQLDDGGWAEIVTDPTGMMPDYMVAIDGDPRSLFDRVRGGFTDFMNNPLNEGLGAAGSGLNDATQFTGGELLSLGGGLLSLNAALEEATPTNVFGTAVGLGGSGILGGTVQGLAQNPLTAPIGMALLFAEGLQADPSNKTGFGANDLATSTNTGFGMEGDKFKQGNVDKASAISQGMGTVANTIADGFGLNIEGDILVQTGNRDPLSVTYGNQETEQTATNRLNYNPETGDILNSTDDIQRFYYTGQDGFDANMLTNDLVKGTTLLAFKAVANDEDTIDISNLSKVAQSPDTYKNSLLAQGYTEQGADTILNIAQVGGVDTMGLLGDRAVVATNKNQYLTQEEIASLLEKGYTEEQIAQYT